MTEDKKEIFNYVVEYDDWESYNATTKKEAIEMFKRDHPQARIRLISR